MMFRGFPIVPPTRPCRYCKGTARTKNPFGPDYECTSCNGTGIDGEPAYGCAVLAAFLIVLALIVIFNWNR
jgi:hypothetical protein